MGKKKIIWFIYRQENLPAIFENAALKKKDWKKLPSMSCLFFFSVLLNHAAFLNVLWPLRMSPSKHSAVRGSALFVPGGVASFTVIRWWKMKDTACRMHFRWKHWCGLTAKKVVYSNIICINDVQDLIVDSHHAARCFDVSILLARANGIVWLGLWILPGTNLE